MADIKKLKSVGICTIKGVIMCTKKKLCNVKGLSEVKVNEFYWVLNIMNCCICEQMDWIRFYTCRKCCGLKYMH